jgi:FMN phosphatase YigB (HAD superfamily)
MKKRPHIELLIVDLDNTLYDWIGFFVPAFYRMIDVAVEILKVDRETLLTDIQVVHQKYGNSEYPFALLETSVVKNRFPGKSRAELARLLDPAFHAFNKNRKELLKLFPGVLETLQFIHESGCKIVAYTEADVRNSLFRIEALGIRQYISRLYAPLSQGLGHPHGKELYVDELRNGFLWLRPKEYRKPNPKILEDIFVEFSLYPEKALYVGDSITKDISMAKRAGTHVAWARYGTKYDKKLWEKLVRVTHWTKEDAAREFQLRNETKGVSPDVELDSFDEVTGHYVFCPASYEVSYQERDSRTQSFLRSNLASVSD